MKSELMLKLKRSGVSNQWKSAGRPTSQKRQKRSQGTSQRKRKRYQVIDDADSDDDWSNEGRRRKRTKRQEKKKRTTRRARIESSDDSDWMGEFLSDSDSDTARRKPKVKTVEYKLSDEDFRSNYAFLLNDDKLLVDPVVKLVPVEMDGPVFIVRDQQVPKVEIKVEPQDIQDDIQMPFIGGLDGSVGTLAESAKDLQYETEMWESNIKDQVMHPDTGFGKERTVVELLTGEERTLVEGTIEFPGAYSQPFTHFGVFSGENDGMTLSNETYEPEEVEQASQLKDIPIDAETSTIPANISSENVNQTEISLPIVELKSILSKGPIVELKSILSKGKAHGIQVFKREAGEGEGISQIIAKDEGGGKQDEMRNTAVNNANETVKRKETSQKTKKGVASEEKTRNIWSMLSGPVQPTEMDKTDAETKNIPGEIRACGIEASSINKNVETENVDTVTERSGPSVNVTEYDQNLVKLQWNLDPLTGRFVESNAEEDGITNESLSGRDEIKEEPMALEKKNVEETDLKTNESVLDNRGKRCKIGEGSTTKPQPLAIDESGEKVVSSFSAKAGTSNRRHKWTDPELRVYHSHLNSDPLLVQKPIVILEELDFVDMVFEDE